LSLKTQFMVTKKSIHVCIYFFFNSITISTTDALFFIIYYIIHPKFQSYKYITQNIIHLNVQLNTVILQSIYSIQY